MKTEDAFKQAVKTFLIAMFAGMVAYFVGKFYETQDWTYFFMLAVLAVVIIGFFYVLYKKHY